MYSVNLFGFRSGEKTKIKADPVYEKPGPFQIEELELCDLKDEEVLVHIAATGICHMDLAGRDD